MGKQEKGKKSKGWVLVLLFFICIGVVVFAIWFNAKAKEQLSKEKQNVVETENVSIEDFDFNNLDLNEIEEEDDTKIKENPYTTTTIFDGTYKFTTTSTNSYGTAFTAKGYLNINDGVCKTIYRYGSEQKDEKTDMQYQGYFGVDDKGSLNILLLDNNKEIAKQYKCTIAEKNLTAELVQGSDLIGNEQKETFTLEFLNKNGDITSLFAADNKAEDDKKEAEYKPQCKVYTYEKMNEDPDDFKGTKVKLTGKVTKITEHDYGYEMEMNITKDETNNTYSDTIYVVYRKTYKDKKISEGSVITIYGESAGNYIYEETLEESETPSIVAKYIES